MEVRLDLGGYAVTLVDTAGLRQGGGDAIEAEGMRRGRVRAAAADLIVWLDEDGAGPSADVAGLGVPMLVLRSKGDLHCGAADAVSIHDRQSLDRLLDRLTRQAADRLSGEAPLVSRARQRQCL